MAKQMRRALWLICICLLLVPLVHAEEARQNVEDVTRGEAHPSAVGDEAATAGAKEKVDINDVKQGQEQGNPAAAEVTKAAAERTVAQKVETARLEDAKGDSKASEAPRSEAPEEAYAQEVFDVEEIEEAESEEEAESRSSDSEEMESGFHMDEFHPSHVYTFPVAAGKEECLYVDIYEGIPARIKGAYFVSSGGSMDISFQLALDIDGSPMQLVDKPSKSEDTFGLVATRGGVYSFCFTNPSHGYSEKIVTFAVHVIRNIEEGLKAKGYAKAQHVVSLKTTVKDIHKTVIELEAEQKFLKERTSRHMMTQDSTEWRVAWYTVFESAFMFAIAFGQVWYVQRLINQRVWV